MRAYANRILAGAALALVACEAPATEPPVAPVAPVDQSSPRQQSVQTLANPQTAVVTDERGADWTIPIDLSGVDVGGYEPFMALRFRCRTFDNLADFKMVAEGWEFETSIRVRSGGEEIVLRRDLDGYFSQSYVFQFRHPEGSEVARNWSQLTAILTAMNETRRITINDQVHVNLEDPRGYLASTAETCVRIGRQATERLNG